MLFRGRTHLKTLVRPAAIQVLLLAAHVALWLYFPKSLGLDALDRYAELTLHVLILVAELWYVVFPLLTWYHSHFEVTDRRIRQRWGILNKHSREIHLDRITQVNEERSIIDRILRCGTIVIYDAANASAIHFHDVPQFHSVREVIDEARHQVHSRGPGPVSPPGDVW